jgi:hypothetical protein
VGGVLEVPEKGSVLFCLCVLRKSRCAHAQSSGARGAPLLLLMRGNDKKINSIPPKTNQHPASAKTTKNPTRPKKTKVNDAKGAEGVAELRQAYEFTLDAIGSDIGSGPLWLDYVAFLAAPKPGTPAYAALWSTTMVSGQEEGTRAAALRCRLLVGFVLLLVGGVSRGAFFVVVCFFVALLLLHI